MKTIIRYTAICLTLLSCKEQWTEESKSMFLNDCNQTKQRPGLTPAQVKGYCQCALDKTMAQYPAIEDVITNKDSATLNAQLEGCAKANY